MPKAKKNSYRKIDLLSFPILAIANRDDKTADTVFVHVGTNDISHILDGEQPIMDVVQGHLTLVKHVLDQYSCLVLVSLILPRIDQ